jgi:hypothetical protein
MLKYNNKDLNQFDVFDNILNNTLKWKDEIIKNNSIDENDPNYVKIIEIINKFIIFLKKLKEEFKTEIKESEIINGKTWRIETRNKHGDLRLHSNSENFIQNENDIFYQDNQEKCKEIDFNFSKQESILYKNIKSFEYNKYKNLLSKSITNNKNLLVFSKSYNTSIVCSYNKIFPDFDIKNLFDDFIIYDNIQDKLKSTFHKRVYIDLEEFEKICHINLEIVRDKININDIIKVYIKDNYEIIPKDISHKIKSSKLYNDVYNMLSYVLNSFGIKEKIINQTIFSSILCELGLEKRRYSDGMYYYGIKPLYNYNKERYKQRNIKDSKIFDQDYEKLLKQRDLDNEIIKNMLNSQQNIIFQPDEKIRKNICDW